MELILTIAVIIVLLLLLGFEVVEILLLAMNFIVLGVFVMFIMFSYSFFRMVTAEKTDAVFTRIARPPKRGFEVAYYMCSGTEYPCAFPSEPLMRKRIYAPEKTYRVRLNRRTNRIYDKYAEMTCIIGFVFCGLFTAPAAWLMYVIDTVGIKGV